MLEFEKLLYSPELKMVLFFLLQKSLKRVQCSNEFKGASRQSSLFCFANYSPSIPMELKVSKEITCNCDKIRDPRQTNMSPEHYF